MNIFLDNGEGHILIKRISSHIAPNKFYTNPSGCNVQLSFVRMGWKGKIPVVGRIDGIIYDASTNWQARNEGISQMHQTADAIIYQSDYSRRLCESLLRKRNLHAKVAVIHNGIEPNWCGLPVEHEGINITVLGKHRRHKRLKEIIELFLMYHSNVTNSHLHIFGKLHDNVPVKHPNIHYYGMVERERMFEVLRVTDFSLHLSKRDSCPNSVLECLSAGIPVITTNKCGGATEMCNLTPGCIVANGDFDNDMAPEYPYRDSFNVITPELRINVLEAMMDMTINKRRVLLPPTLHSSYVADKYMEVLQSVC